MQKGHHVAFFDAVRVLDLFSVSFFGEVLFDFYGRGMDTDTKDGAAVLKDIIPRADRSFPEERIENLYSAALSLKRELFIDAESIYSRDPAAESIDEVICSYPGFYAIFCHRISHVFYEAGIYLLPRMISEYAHSLTGIDIHPGARIGEGFSIDHGTGIVIGESAEIGKCVSLYHGVTVGAKSLPGTEEVRKLKKEKRHPTIKDGCIICAGAQIFGKDTVIGENSIIGAGARITASVLPNTVVYCKESAERRIKNNGDRNE